MPSLPADARAMRQTLLGGCLGFVVGFMGALGICIYFVLRVMPRDGWWELISSLISVLVVPFWGGLLGAAAVSKVLERWHYSIGGYRCVHCNRPLRGVGMVCACRGWEREVRRRRAGFLRHFRHYRRRMSALAMIAVAVVALVAVTMVTLPPVGRHGLIIEVLIRHGFICIMAAAVVKLVSAVLEVMKCGRRFRLQAIIIVRALTIWGVVMIATFVPMT